MPTIEHPTLGVTKVVDDAQDWVMSGWLVHEDPYAPETRELPAEAPTVENEPAPAETIGE